MMGQEGLAELGVAGIALVAVIMLIDFIRKRWRQSEDGDRRGPPAVIGCPNKVEGLADTLKMISKQSGEQTKLLTAQIRVLEHNRGGIDRLVDQHKPAADGRETWKVSPRMERLTEESRDLLRELVIAVKNGR